MIIDVPACEHTEHCECSWWSGWVGTRVHVVPISDTYPHTAPACACCPRIQMHVVSEGRYGRMGWMVIHNSWDGRETEEINGV